MRLLLLLPLHRLLEALQPMNDARQPGGRDSQQEQHGRDALMDRAAGADQDQQPSEGFGAWRPITTAPKDGTEVLVLLDYPGQSVVHIARWRSREEWESSGQYCGGWDSLEDWEGWWSYTRNSVSQEKLEGWRLPTHWHPMLAHGPAPNG